MGSFFSWTTIDFLTLILVLFWVDNPLYNVEVLLVFPILVLDLFNDVLVYSLEVDLFCSPILVLVLDGWRLIVEDGLL